MKIRPQGEDTCEKCMGIVQQAASIYRQYESSSATAKGNDAPALNRDAPAIKFSPFSEFDNKDELDEEVFIALVYNHEEIVEKVCVRISEYTAMRELADEYIKVGKEDLKNGVPLRDRVVTRTMDMAQNAEIPHLGSEQLGKAYYLSPLNQYIHGIADNATETVIFFCLE